MNAQQTPLPSAVTLAGVRKACLLWVYVKTLCARNELNFDARISHVILFGHFTQNLTLDFHSISEPRFDRPRL